MFIFWWFKLPIQQNYPAEALIKNMTAYVITCNCDIIGEVLKKITMSTCWISTTSNEDFQPSDLSISCKVTNKGFNDLPMYIIVYLSIWSASSIWDRKTEGNPFYFLSDVFLSSFMLFQTLIFCNKSTFSGNISLLKGLERFRPARAFYPGIIYRPYIKLHLRRFFVFYHKHFTQISIW